MPPGGFVAAVVKLAMMGAAERYREVIADLPPKCPRLREADVVSVGGRRAAQQARLRGDVAQVLLVADAQGLAEGQGALVDALPELPRDGSIRPTGSNGRHRSVLRHWCDCHIHG